MPSTVKRLVERGLVRPPQWLADNIHYETIMGSVAYGVSSDTSDMDVYGFCTPPKDMIFPHLAGEILGFGRQVKRFEQWQEHHILDQSELSGRGRSHDFAIFSIIKYFQLAMDNNPNLIDSLFTPRMCVLHTTHVGELVRENRRLFLHKGAWHKFKGYAYSQLHKMRTKEPQGKRKEMREEYGFDVKFAYHVVRLLDEAEQILEHQDIDIQRAREQLKEIRRGGIPEEEIRRWAAEKEAQLEKLYHESTLQHSPDEGKIKTLLLQCLEQHYGSLEKAITIPGAERRALQQIAEIVDRIRRENEKEGVG